MEPSSHAKGYFLLFGTAITVCIVAWILIFTFMANEKNEAIRLAKMRISLHPKAEFYDVVAQKLGQKLIGSKGPLTGKVHLCHGK